MKPVHFLFGLMLLAWLVPGCGNPPGEPAATQPTPTLEQAIQDARAELQHQGYDTADRPLRPQADDANTAWTQRTERQPALLQSPKVQAMKLANRSYWAIYFAPQPPAGAVAKGGDAYVFVDRATGQIIGTLFGE